MKFKLSRRTLLRASGVALGLPFLEAMMLGTAVVASNAGGLSELVEDGRTGILVPLANVGALSSAIVRLLNDRTLAEAMGRGGRRRAVARFRVRV